MLERTGKTELAVTHGVSLTPRQREIALLVMSGLRNKEIASELRLCEGTVKIHLHNIFQKLGIKSRTALLARRRRHF
jgi:two-component system, NarL family, nitrate/nitrite response regulator NarL